VSAIEVFEAVWSSWWMQFTSGARRGDLIPVAVGPDDDRRSIPSARASATEDPGEMKEKI